VLVLTRVYDCAVLELKSTRARSTSKCVCEVGESVCAVDIPPRGRKRVVVNGASVCGLEGAPEEGDCQRRNASVVQPTQCACLQSIQSVWC
jgi:hypothetical protein